ncbi:hypothetical protein ACN47E_001470 [Coniothyrium glycines]
MAPKKKEEKASASEATDMVLHYIRKQNRPYSAIEVSANLHNKVTKSSAVKILKDLHEQKQIEGRAAGKQIVYHAIQDANDSCTPEELAALDDEIISLRTQTANLQATAKTLRADLASLNSTLSTTDLLSAVQALEPEKAELTARLEALRAGKAKKVTKEEREAIDAEAKKWQLAARRRAKIALDMWKEIECAVETKEEREELRELFELDE